MFLILLYHHSQFSFCRKLKVRKSKLYSKIYHAKYRTLLLQVYLLIVVHIQIKVLKVKIALVKICNKISKMKNY